MSYIETSGVSKSYAGRTVVNGVSIRVDRGRVVGLLGPNGAGKTTTFYMVVGLVRPDKGTVSLDGDDITKDSMHARARRGIGYLPQEASIFRNLTVMDNILGILEFVERDKRKRMKRAEDILGELSLTHVADSPGYALSGGERRRAEIARALTTNPRYILLDEPFAGVDPIAVGEIQRVIAYLKQKNLGILITDHNVRETLQITDHAYVMNKGTLLVEGGMEEIISNPDAKRIYLGDTFTMDKQIAKRDHGSNIELSDLAKKQD